MVLTGKGKIYTGMTTDVKKRIDTHNAGRGAKCLRGQLPVHFLMAFGPMPRREAAGREAQIKALPVQQKVALLARADRIEK